MDTNRNCNESRYHKAKDSKAPTRRHPNQFVTVEERPCRGDSCIMRPNEFPRTNVARIVLVLPKFDQQTTESHPHVGNTDARERNPAKLDTSLSLNFGALSNRSV